MSTIILFLNKQKYELLLIALIQHLFVGIFLRDMEMYAQLIWPINMLILGIASVGVFIEKGKLKNTVRKILFFFVVLFPLCLSVFGTNAIFMLLLNITFCLFYAFILVEVLRFLIKPSYINRDIITASACGYFLLIEISVFLMQIFYYNNPNSFKGIGETVAVSNSAHIFMDLVYFCSITLTSIGYGDITPNSYQTKLITAFLGIAGQFYAVVLVGILISKFTASNKDN